MLKWWQLKVGDYVLVKFYAEHYKNKAEIIAIVEYISGDNIKLRTGSGNICYIYASGIGSSGTGILSRYKLFKAKESDFLIERL